MGLDKFKQANAKQQEKMNKAFEEAGKANSNKQEEPIAKTDIAPEKAIPEKKEPFVNDSFVKPEISKEAKPVEPIQTSQVEAPAPEKKRGRPTFSSKGKQNREQVTITLPRPELALAREYAEENGTTLAMVCGEALADWVEKKGLK